MRRQRHARDRPPQVGEGDAGRELAFDVYVHRLRKYVGAYHAVLGRVDAVAFTAGVGENAAAVRAAALAGLEALGMAVDPERQRRAWRRRPG